MNVPHTDKRLPLEHLSPDKNLSFWWVHPEHGKFEAQENRLVSKSQVEARHFVDTIIKLALSIEVFFTIIILVENSFWPGQDWRVLREVRRGCTSHFLFALKRSNGGDLLKGLLPIIKYHHLSGGITHLEVLFWGTKPDSRANLLNLRLEATEIHLPLKCVSFILQAPRLALELEKLRVAGLR